MKIVLFCGGMGMRMREASTELPKPLIPVCGTPILVHLMKYYIHYGHTDFILCLGYLGGKIAEYFTRYAVGPTTHNALGHAVLNVYLPGETPSQCQVTLADTGLHSSIGMRLKKVESLVADEEVFMANYADGLADVALDVELANFLDSEKAITFATVKPRQTFHVINTNAAGEVQSIDEMGSSGIRVNGGFFILRPKVFNFLGEKEDLLYEPMTRMVNKREVLAHQHDGFWACMDTLKEKQEFDERCIRGDMPWQVWHKEASLVAC